MPPPCGPARPRERAPDTVLLERGVMKRECAAAGMPEEEDAGALRSLDRSRRERVRSCAVDRADAVLVPHAFDEPSQLRRFGQDGHETLPTGAAEKPGRAARRHCRSPLPSGLPLVPERGVASIVKDERMSAVRPEVAVRSDGRGERVPGQLIDVSERTRPVVAVARPVEQRGQIVPVENPDLGKGAAATLGACR